MHTNLHVTVCMYVCTHVLSTYVRTYVGSIAIIQTTRSLYGGGGGGGGYMYVRTYVPAYVALHSWTVGTKWEGAIVMPSSSSCQLAHKERDNKRDVSPHTIQSP